MRRTVSRVLLALSISLLLPATGTRAEEPCRTLTLQDAAPADHVVIDPPVQKDKKGKKFTGTATLVLDDDTEIDLVLKRRLKKAKKRLWSWSLKTPKKAEYKVRLKLQTIGDGDDEVLSKFKLLIKKAAKVKAKDLAQATLGGCEGAPLDDPPPPPPVESLPTNLNSSTEFLHAGDDPVQEGLVLDEIDPVRTAVVRGMVTERGGTPLVGVEVTVVGHPEFGRTTTLPDKTLPGGQQLRAGEFSMVVNGGGRLTLNYARDGYLQAQRTVEPKWADYAWADDVVMTPLDGDVTTIDLTSSAPVQTARGSEVSDADGTRRATLLFPEGLAAELVWPDGSTQAVTSLSVRATEYTVGDDGPAAMPAPLPSRSGYTYCVALTVQEAIDAGASEVRFSNGTVAFYVENFLQFPVGGDAPVGYYDPAAGAWMASDDGRVVEIVSITDGRAELDIDGDGLADDAAALTQIGVTDDELEALATTAGYMAGTSLWRAPIPHFSAWDINWPIRPPNGAKGPPGGGGGGGGAGGGASGGGVNGTTGGAPGGANCKNGSIIEVEPQVLRESIPIAGTPYSLNYRSDRARGRESEIYVVLSEQEVPDSLIGIELEVTVAGRRLTEPDQFPPEPNQSHTVIWDGKDAYGRYVQGEAVAHVELRYLYEAVYTEPSPEFVRSWSRVPADVVTLGPARLGIAIPTEYETRVGTLDARGLGLGGWSLSAQHAYDPTGGVLHRGDGAAVRRADRIDSSIRTIAGAPFDGTVESGLGGPAVDAWVGAVRDIAIAPDGSYYIASENLGVRYVDADGIIHQFAGIPGGPETPLGDGGPATDTYIRAHGLALTPDGSVLIADSIHSRIRRVDTDGIITTVAGSTPVGANGGFSGDGGPAASAELFQPRSVVLGPDGSLYIADTFNNRVRCVDPDGTISTVAGSGARSPLAGNGIPAIEANITVDDIAVGPDGSLYVASDLHRRVFRVDNEGRLWNFAGTGVNGSDNDGQLATEAAVRPRHVAVDSVGNVFVGDLFGRVRIVDPSGRIRTVAGDGGISSLRRDGEGGPATAATLGNTQGGRPLGVGPDDRLYIGVDAVDGAAVRRLESRLPSFTNDSILIASGDGAETYEFDAFGSHLVTRSTLTGEQLYEFAYDERGVIESVTDSYGNVTTVRRDANGNATAIVGPFGQETTLAIDPAGSGYLVSVSDPNGGSHTFTYASEGLLATFTDPNENTSTLTYDAVGRLIRDEGADGGFLALERERFPGGYEVTTTTAEGRAENYSVEWLETGDVRRVLTGADGTETEWLLRTDGSETRTYADGTVMTERAGPDPRWGMQSPIRELYEVETPGGLLYREERSRSVELGESEELLDVVAQTDVITVNGRAFTSAFDGRSNTFTATSPEGRVRTVSVDRRGVPLRLTVGDLAPIVTAYDDRGRPASVALGGDQNAREIQFTYGEDGFVSAVSDPLARTQTFERDAAGRTNRVVLPGDREVLLAYDPRGNTTSLTPPGRPAHVFTHTEKNRVASYTAPAVGENTTRTSYTYNLDRELLKETRADGGEVVSEYDGGGCGCSGGKLTSLSLPGGDRTSLFAYDAAGRLASIAGPYGVILAYGYDGDLLTSATWSGNVQGEVSWTYDSDRRVATESVNGGWTVAYQYDDDGLVTEAGDLTISRDLATGLVTGTQLGVITESMEYDDRGRLSRHRATAGATTLYDVRYTRDVLDRITRRVETIQGVTTTYGYAYDEAGRLATVTEGGTQVSSYTYDANGNRTAHETPGGTVNGTFDDQDRITDYGGASFTYTANGELLARTDGSETTTYDYDARGNLLQADLPGGTEISYEIDGQHRRVGRRVDGTLVQGLLYRDQLNPVAELGDASNVVRRFVYGARPYVPEYMATAGGSQKVICDHLGSVRLVVDAATGAVVQRIDYDEYGVVTQDTSPGTQPFGFAGGLDDGATGLVRFGARDYDAATGRWTVADPIGFEGGDTNLLAYVAGDPVNSVDPAGLAVAPVPPGWGPGSSTMLALSLTPAGGAAAAAKAAAKAVAVIAGGVVGGAIHDLMKDEVKDAIKDALKEGDTKHLDENTPGFPFKPGFEDEPDPDDPC